MLQIQQNMLLIIFYNVCRINNLKVMKDCTFFYTLTNASMKHFCVTDVSLLICLDN